MEDTVRGRQLDSPLGGWWVAVRRPILIPNVGSFRPAGFKTVTTPKTHGSGAQWAANINKESQRKLNRPPSDPPADRPAASCGLALVPHLRAHFPEAREKNTNTNTSIQNRVACQATESGLDPPF